MIVGTVYHPRGPTWPLSAGEATRALTGRLIVYPCYVVCSRVCLYSGPLGSAIREKHVDTTVLNALFHRDRTLSFFYLPLSFLRSLLLQTA